jgi:tetratricopeptide (TPR) repeat protein
VLGGDVARRFADRTRERTAISASDAAAAAAARGLAAFGARDYAAAITALTACLDAEPQNAAAGFVLGWAHAAAGDDRAAVSAWRTAVIADSTVVPAYLALIDAYTRLGSPELALQVARSGLKALPDSVELRDRVSRLERR